MLEQSLARYQQGGAAEAETFIAAVEAYAEFHWEHMGREEKEVLPLAEKHLTAGDWEAIDAAFTGPRRSARRRVLRRGLSQAVPEDREPGPAADRSRASQ